MTESLIRWIATADALRHIEHFQTEIPLALTFIRERADDYYTSLVGDLFDRMRENSAESTEWARLGNAFAQFVDDDAGLLTRSRIDRSEGALYAAAAFYCGGFPASAYLSMARMIPIPREGTVRACYDLLMRPAEPVSGRVLGLVAALRLGDVNFIAQEAVRASEAAASALASGPDDWVPARLYEQLMHRFTLVNLRAVLPARVEGYWNSLIDSLVSRIPSTWEFFPSQIQAIQGQLFDNPASYTLQMPTGAGKTTLSETLLFDHLQSNPDEAAVLLVPFRSLASELRRGLVRNLNSMGINSRCAYGGTVPSGDEIRSLDETRLVVATPEALSGLLSADQGFLQRISLVICDEGHLLGMPSRGILLELLLARLKLRETGAPRFVFISAIVPNVQEINAWLGGTDETVIRSDYRPATADFAVLRQRNEGSSRYVDLEVHPQLTEPARFTVAGFLSRTDFQYFNPPTNRNRTLNFDSYKTKAVAAARKALPMGTAVIFAANKRGAQGAIGVTKELLEQLGFPLTLPTPIQYSNAARITAAVEYLRNEFGEDWVGTRALASGAVLHHGDIPQETREVLEEMLRRKHVLLAICTSTLAEGVNLPIRTLVLYSVRRRTSEGAGDLLLSRDIKNLVGRAGRAGATTRGLVICANAEQWPAIERVATDQPGEDMTGALKTLIDRLQELLALQNHVLTNEDLERTDALAALVDGIDSTLIDLAVEEISEETLAELAVNIANQTYAAQTIGEASGEVLRNVFRLRAARVASICAAGRIEWIRSTGAKLWLLATVESDLAPLFENWETLADPADEVFVGIMLEWAWNHGKLARTIKDAYRLEEGVSVDTVRASFFTTVRRWIAGDTYPQIAAASGQEIDDILAIQTRAVSFGLQTVIEQGVALIGKLLESQGRTVSPAVAVFSDCLRFGVSTASACALSAAGIRHRRAAILLANNVDVAASVGGGRVFLLSVASQVLRQDATGWRARLGDLVYENTLADVS
jgi:superfamily II DNA/RNA helicase